MTLARSIVLVLSSVLTPLALAGSTATVGLDYASAYVFRGVTLNEEAVLQPSLSLENSSGVSLGVWGNFDIKENKADDIGGAKQEQQFSEIDIIIGYALPIDSDVISASIGMTEYTYPNAEAAADREVSVNVTLDLPVTTNLSLNYGVDGAINKAMYSELSFEKEVLNQGDFAMSLGASVGHVKPDEGDSGISHGTVSAGLSYSNLTASVTHVIETDEDINDLEDQVETYGTLGASFNF